MSAVDPAAAVTGSSRKGFWSSNSTANTAPVPAVVATDVNGGRLQATKASLKKLNFFRRSKGGRQLTGEQGSGSSLVQENRHISISHPMPVYSNILGNFQHNDATDELQGEFAATRLNDEALPPPELLQSKTMPLIWEPLPLFKVYSRSIKYTTLPAPCLSAETILRHNTQRSQAESTGDSAYTTRESHDEEPTTSKKGKRKSLRSIDMLNKAGWTRKIYLLDTEGHMLQYGIEGPFDRLPEKILKLGPNTAAFASDAIPGKHWVIQISNSMDDKVGTSDPKKHFFTLLGHDHKREEQKSILMVLNSPEEMESWLASVRKEIEKYGGKEYISEDLFHQKRTSTVPSREGVEGLLGRRTTSINDDNLLPPSRHPSLKRDTKNLAGPHGYYRRSLPPGESIDSPSLATCETDGDRLHETYRLSYASAATHSASSPSTSPCPSSGVISDDQDRNGCQLSEFQIAYNRLSNYTLSEEDPMQEQVRKESHNPPPPVKSVVPRVPAPNFSVPVYSKRYSAQTPRNSTMLRSVSNESHALGRAVVPHQGQGQQKLAHLNELPSRPMRQRAASTSATESRAQGNPSLHSDGLKDQTMLKRYSSGLDNGFGFTNTNSGRKYLESREQKVFAPELNSSQGYKLYNKPHPHIPETLDEDPSAYPGAPDQERWPIASNDYLEIPSATRSNRSSWGSNASGHRRVDAMIHSGADPNDKLVSESISSDMFKRASWGAPESPRIDAFEYNPRSPSPHTMRRKRSSWGHASGHASTNDSSPASPISRRSSSRFSNRFSPSNMSTPASNTYSINSSQGYRMNDEFSSVGLATSSIVRSKSTPLIDLGPPPAPPPDCPLPKVPVAKAAQHISTLPPAPPPSCPLPEAPPTAPYGVEPNRPRLRGSSSRSTLNHDSRRRSGRSTHSQSGRSFAELARERRITALQEEHTFPLVVPPGRDDETSQSDDVKAKKASMVNAF